MLLQYVDWLVINLFSKKIYKIYNACLYRLQYKLKLSNLYKILELCSSINHEWNMYVKENIFHQIMVIIHYIIFEQFFNHGG